MTVLVSIIVSVAVHEVARRTRPLDVRFPPIPGEGAMRSLKYNGELVLGADTLVNVVLAPLLPAALDAERVERVMDEAIRAYPHAARELGFAPTTTPTTTTTTSTAMEPWRAALRAYVRAFNTASVHTAVGVVAAQTILDDSANYNAKVMAFLEARRDDNDDKDKNNDKDLPIPESRILFVVGNYRSGTSILTRVLTCDKRAVYFPQWALKAGIDVPSAEEGMRHPTLMDGYSALDRLALLSPEIAKAAYTDHPMSPRLAEEDGFFWAANAFAVPGFFVNEFARPRANTNTSSVLRCNHGIKTNATTSSPSNIKDDDHDTYTRAYHTFASKTLRAYLKAWLHPESPLWTQLATPTNDSFLVLKAPSYGAYVDVLRAAFPQATFVATHRDVRDGAGNIMKLFSQSAALLADASKLRARDVARNALDHYGGIARGLARHKDLIDLHVPHRDVLRDPMHVVVEELYPRLGITPTPDALDNMRDLLARMKSSVSTKKLIDVEAMGIDLDVEIAAREEFDEYRKAYRFVGV